MVRLKDKYRHFPLIVESYRMRILISLLFCQLLISKFKGYLEVNTFNFIIDEVLFKHLSLKIQDYVSAKEAIFY